MLASRRLTKTALRTAPTKVAAPLPVAGGAGKKGGGMWAALADSDSEESDTGRSVSPVKRPAVIPVTPVAEKKVVTVHAGPTDHAAARSVAAAPPHAVRGQNLPAVLEGPASLEAAWREMMESDPFFLAMERGEMWGDLLCAAELPAAASLPPAVAEAEEADPLAAIYSNPHTPLRAREADLWEQPFAAALEEYWPDTYDTREMSDVDYHAMMSWLFSKGWYVVAHDRAGVHAYPDNAPSRRWDAATMAPEEEHHVRWADMEEPKPKAHGGAGCCGGHRAKKERGPVTIPRFCREGAACAAGGSCRYVHGDTIPRVNEPCAFGAGCGASDPTGVKRSQCLRMHPGEVWSPELVIHRP
jgi:hypothetical protein